MHSYVIKITNTEGQTRITIPKLMAKETGLNKAKVAIIESREDGTIKIEVYRGDS